MNIPAINNIKFFQNIQNTTPKTKTENSSYFGLKMSQPLAKDTVSFKANVTKIVESIDSKSILKKQSHKVPKKTLESVCKDAATDMPKIQEFLDTRFLPFVYSDERRYGFIKKISPRVKTEDSVRKKIMQYKLGGAGIKKIEQEIRDLNGAKIILSNSTKKKCDKLIQLLIQAIEKGEAEILQIENKRPMAVQDDIGMARERFDYANVDQLKELYNVAKKHQKTKIIEYKEEDPTETNYPALHIIIKLKGCKLPFELQIMGADVALFKDLDDLLYKLLSGKDVDPKYEPIKQIIEELKKHDEPFIKQRQALMDSIGYINACPQGNNEDKILIEQLQERIENMGSSPIEKFNKYRADTFLFQRVREADNKSSKVQLPVSKYRFTDDDKLNKKLDFTYLYNLMLKCRGGK